MGSLIAYGIFIYLNDEDNSPDQPGLVDLSYDPTKNPPDNTIDGIFVPIFLGGILSVSILTIYLFVTRWRES